ncbi:adenosylcobinamide amidohydrolase [Mycobacterium talmoniae]|uniref:Adenosylcobinamide amidohydrolase n=1 Tax=Mycobacterium talmoniae TaxID=1858794 RepID=A0A1S1NL22_9MYCO|nr:MULTISPECIES: adenosylcobinamide amidohydrolase [Mycobacterium]OHV03885.1 adenosylcobinamide amidohydrolase [Mycobacterium talmoniae]TDH51574.1 adenosylcobinamide amidohydrolase [Mycobacterium eburneum]
MDPIVTARTERARRLPVLVWRFAEPRHCISSGPLGGGIGARDWVVNATVPLDYDRHDPDRHLAEIGAALGLPGRGAGLLTAVDVTRHHLAGDGGVRAAATVGLSSPAWAAAPDGHFRRELPSGAALPDYRAVDYPVGTINIVVAVPVRLSEAALVNAVATATEAKVQALHEAGVRATGTASDAVVVHCPTAGAVEPYGGPRSVFGARIARAVHAAVLAGSRRWIASHRESRYADTP